MKTLTEKTVKALPAGWHLVIIESVKYGACFNYEMMELKMQNRQGEFKLQISIEDYDDDLSKVSDSLYLAEEIITDRPKSLLNKMLLVKVEYDSYTDEYYIEDIKPALDNNILENLLTNMN